MEKTIEIQLAEHGERIATALEGQFILIPNRTDESIGFNKGLAYAAQLARTTK